MWTSINSYKKKRVSRLLGRALWIFLLSSVGFGPISSSTLADVGLLPTPTLQGVQVQATATFDIGTQLYTYAYQVSNPNTNTGEITLLLVDVTTRIPKAFVPAFDSAGLTVPIGGDLIPFDQELAGLQPLLSLPAGTNIVPFGQRVPSGWNGGLGVDGQARFSTGTGTPDIMPGSSLGGFELISRGMPTIRKMQVVPFWVFLVDNIEAVTPEQEAAAREVEKAIVFHTVTLGPSALTAGTFGHWDQLRDDLNQAIQLGWIPDQTLANTLVSQLASARQALDAQDGTLAKTRLQTLIQSVNQSTPAQRRREVADLLVLNADRLMAATPNTPIPFEPKLKLVPQSSTLPLGTLYTLTATMTNAGDPANPPIPGFQLEFEVSAGPHTGQELNSVTDTQGKLSFSYLGRSVGTDTISVSQYGEVPTEFGSAKVTWTGGPDLAVPLFIPPLLRSEGGKTVFVTEWTSNLGSVPAPASTTRYFIAPNGTVDPATARVLGERAIPALGPGERSESGTVPFTLPSDLPAGVYSLAACADAPGAVIELDEQNNCSFSALKTESAILVPAEAPTNQPPVCSQAVPSPARLWPPNHKLVPMTIQGVTDPDNDPITLRVTGITQDEPTNGLGDGDTSPDGFGVGTPQAQVRAERSGTGNGRVYAITFSAEDDKGGSCSGTVTVGVPHDQGKGSTPIDDGQRFDSTKP